MSDQLLRVDLTLNPLWAGWALPWKGLAGMRGRVDAFRATFAGSNWGLAGDDVVSGAKGTVWVISRVPIRDDQQQTLRAEWDSERANGVNVTAVTKVGSVDVEGAREDICGGGFLPNIFCTIGDTVGTIVTIGVYAGVAFGLYWLWKEAQKK